MIINNSPFHLPMHFGEKLFMMHFSFYIYFVMLREIKRISNARFLGKNLPKRFKFVGLGTTLGMGRGVLNQLISDPAEPACWDRNSVCAPFVCRKNCILAKINGKTGIIWLAQVCF